MVDSSLYSIVPPAEAGISLAYKEKMKGIDSSHNITILVNVIGDPLIDGHFFSPRVEKAILGISI